MQPNCQFNAKTEPITQIYFQEFLIFEKKIDKLVSMERYLIYP